MSALVVIAVLALSVWLFGWIDVFHLAVGTPVLIASACIWRAIAARHRRALLDDVDGLIDETTVGPAGRIVRGVAAGLAMSALLGAAFALASKTPLYPMLVDVGAKRLLGDLAVLERLDQWNEVASRLSTLPTTSAPATRVLLAQKKVSALIKLAEGAEDVAAACELYRRAQDVTAGENVDSALVDAKLEWCAARAARRPLPAGARADIVRLDRLGADSVRLEVRVVDEGNRPLAGLVAEDFAVMAGGKQPLKVSALSVRPSPPLPGHRLSVVVDQTAGSRSDSIATAAYLVAALGPGDSVEIIGCGSSAHVVAPRTEDLRIALRALLLAPATERCVMTDAAWLALDRLGGGPRRSLVVIGDVSDPAAIHPAADLVSRSRTAGVPVFVVPLGSPATELTALGAESGGSVIDLRSRSLESLRSRFRAGPGSSPLTYVLVGTGALMSSGRLDVRVGGDNAASATTRF